MRALPALPILGGLLIASAALAQDGAPGKGIYTCTTADGRKLTGDRPIPECTAREQRVLNPDGSQRTTLPPFLSPEERAAKEALDRRATAERLAQLDAIRRDRTLAQRYPTEAAHQRARNLALDDANKATRISERRIKDHVAKQSGAALDPTQLAGTMRPCGTCASELELPLEAHRGPFWQSAPARYGVDIEDLIHQNQRDGVGTSITRTRDKVLTFDVDTDSDSDAERPQLNRSVLATPR